MRFIQAFALNDGPTDETTRRYVFETPGGNFMVVKVFPVSVKGTRKNAITVKFWSGELDYRRTVSSWATKVKFNPSAHEVVTIRAMANQLVGDCGYSPLAIVNRV